MRGAATTPPATPPSTRRGIVCAGNWVVDRVKIIDHWPQQDSLARILGEQISNGGAPYNVLKDLARLGARFPLEAIGVLGDDADGRRILDDCRAHGIDTAQLHFSTEAPTCYTEVMTVRGTGRRTFFYQAGTNALLGPGNFDFARTRAKILHLGYLLLLPALDALDADGLPRAAGVFRAARAAGLVTSLDCVSADGDGFATVVSKVLPEVDFLFANDFEAARLTGVSLRSGNAIDPQSVETAARRLIEAGVRRAVVLHFPESAFALERDGTVHWQPSVDVPAEAVQGAAGAGDALAAGVLHGLHEEWPMPRALRLGTCAAAASLFDATCSAGVRSVHDCLALGATCGFLHLPGVKASCDH